MVDSYHIYGSYFEEFKGFLNTLKTKSFEERTYSSSFAEPFFEEAREKIKNEKKT
jgi:thymidylate synthase